MVSLNLPLSILSGFIVLSTSNKPSKTFSFILLNSKYLFKVLIIKHVSSKLSPIKSYVRLKVIIEKHKWALYEK